MSHKSCLHEDYPIDVSGGSETCTGCGLVLGPIYVHSYHSDSSFSEDTQPTEIKQVVDRYSLPAPIEKAALDVLQRLPPQICKRNKSVATAYAMHEALCDFEVPRSRNEICRMFAITTKEFNGFQNRCFSLGAGREPKIDTLKPSDLLPRVYISTLQKISFDTLKLWAAMADKLYTQVSSTPASVLAFVIYKHMKASRNKRWATMSDIAKICNVSPTSIKRLNRSLKHISFDTHL